ncbi:MAG TPA: tRNA (adenosine(37)-N6)-threonylcarbamoyltransferase complex dimerization subunit type 1 TsaB [Candidatus Eisenbacteria bacterium]|nr:tRNA (adenosine(37)-N6)-threonylcarbamoyltransferase complex dimerization subunit type 1 TsaB [Candidatus Eisenbacteria bacterium]
MKDSWTGNAGTMRSILGIDSASPRGSVALLVDGALRAEAPLPPGGHSSGLAAAAESLAAGAGIGLASLAGLAVSRGPGSFTGLRIGLAWAKGLAMGASIPLALVSAHEAMAHAARDAEDLLRVTVTPGERHEVEIALWAAPGASSSAAADSGEADARPVALEPPVSIPETDLDSRLLALVAGRRFVAIPSNDAIAALLDDDELPRRDPLPLAASVARLGDLLLRAGQASDLTLASPAYGRAPNARKPAR